MRDTKPRLIDRVGAEALRARAMVGPGACVLYAFVPLTSQYALLSLCFFSTGSITTDESEAVRSRTRPAGCVRRERVPHDEPYCTGAVGKHAST